VVIPHPAVSGVVQRAVGVLAEPSQPAAVLTEQPPTRVGAVQKREDNAFEQNTVAK